MASDFPPDDLQELWRRQPVEQVRLAAVIAGVPADLALKLGIDFHRAELERQRDLLQGIWSWYPLPLVPGMVVLNIGFAQRSGSLRPALIVGGACAAVFIGVGWLN
ncbi:MAG: hypothetical protein FJW39_24060 [Acidobacteria bacterium]|nr:hypothetical protein [Acidobacteriota bacterium]